jgi:hypothetical protein
VVVLRKECVTHRVAVLVYVVPGGIAQRDGLLGTDVK